MKQFVLILLSALFLVDLFTHYYRSKERLSDFDKYDVADFYAVYNKYAEEHNIKQNTIDSGVFRDIAPPNVFEETGCQIFKMGSAGESFLLYDDNLYHIGIAFGGLGIVDIETCDFDGNGKKDIVYTFSCGSGIHSTGIGYFNLSKMKEAGIEMFSVNISGYAQNELVLNKKSDRQVEVYTAKIKDIANLTFEKEKYFGEIREAFNMPLFLKR